MEEDGICGAQSSAWRCVADLDRVSCALSSPVGRRLYAVGASREAAALSAIRVGRLKILAFEVSGGASALGGILNFGRAGAAHPDAGSRFLPALAAGFLGATTVRPGWFKRSRHCCCRSLSWCWGGWTSAARGPFLQRAPLQRWSPPWGCWISETSDSRGGRSNRLTHATQSISLKGGSHRAKGKSWLSIV